MEYILESLRLNEKMDKLVKTQEEEINSKLDINIALLHKFLLSVL